MARTKIDFHQSRQDAAAALSSLREVGLNPGDIGGAWRVGENSFDAADDASTSGPGQLIDVEEIGLIRFSGWLADAAQEAAAHGPATPLSVIFDDLTDDAELQRVRDTLASGGGIVGIRARDTFKPEQD
nr:hypothetical protein [uncultured Brevundimonas sp.]